MKKLADVSAVGEGPGHHGRGVGADFCVSCINHIAKAILIVETLVVVGAGPGGHGHGVGVDLKFLLLDTIRIHPYFVVDSHVVVGAGPCGHRNGVGDMLHDDGVDDAEPVPQAHPHIAPRAEEDVVVRVRDRAHQHACARRWASLLCMIQEREKAFMSHYI